MSSSVANRRSIDVARLKRWRGVETARPRFNAAAATRAALAAIALAATADIWLRATLN